MLGDWIGGLLYDKIVESVGGSGQTKGYAGGGQVTRGGRSMGAVKRTVTSKGKIERKIPRQPGKINIKPGADVGGEDKIFGIFPKPASKNESSSFGVINDSAKEFQKAKYFGPILAVASKILLGQKPNQSDYKNIGYGINMLVSEGLDQGKLKGGIAAAFAGGGIVDIKTLEAIGEGGDISDWVASTFKESIDKSTDKVLSDIQSNLSLRSPEKPLDKSDPTLGIDDDVDIDGGGGMTQGKWGPLLDLIAGKESGGNYEAMYPSTVLKGATKMTIAEVARRATGAVGKYQQLPQYLVGRAKAAGLNPDRDLYSPENQEKIIINVNIKGRGGERWLKGEISDDQFMQGLSQEFASLPNAQGRFYYPGQRSSMTAEKVKAALSKVKKGGYSQQELAMVNDKYEGESGKLGGSGKFIQGNSGASKGVHFHIGPGSQVKGTILQRQYFADARATAKRAIDYFLGQGRSVYDGRRGVYYKSGSEVAAAQRAHTGSGSAGGIDMQVDFEKPIPFPLQTMGMAYRPNGFGVSADISGSNSFVAHGRYDEKGRVAPQEGMKIYHTGTPSAKEGIAKLLKKESVLDVDTSESLRKLDPALITQLNQQKTPAGILNVLRKYASYESGASQNIIVPYFDSGSDEYDSQESSSIPMISMSADDDSFETLYRGG
jgi:hypothetical protein